MFYILQEYLQEKTFTYRLSVIAFVGDMVNDSVLLYQSRSIYTEYIHDFISFFN